VKSETLEARLQSLTLGCRRAAAKVDDPLLFPAAQAVYRGLALGLAKTAFDTAIREGTDVTPAFGPRSPEDRPWKHNRPRTATESLQECYAVVQRLQCGPGAPQWKNLTNTSEPATVSQLPGGGTDRAEPGPGLE